jgi:hypothetical protein
MRLYLDIETVGTDDPAVIEEIAAGVKPPGNMSKPETIAKWEAEEKPALVAEAISKTAFDGALGRVICICYAIDEGNIVSIHGDEPDMLAEFHRQTKDVHSPSVVGHNVQWDTRFLWQRYVVNNIKKPRLVAAAVRVKPWDVEDTMLLWNPERDRKIRLDKLCRALSVPSPKGEMDGSKIGEYYRAGRIQEIVEYCAGDVAAVRECYRRMVA